MKYFFYILIKNSEYIWPKVNSFTSQSINARLSAVLERSARALYLQQQAIHVHARVALHHLRRTERIVLL